jgi:hypothetical protein
MVTVGTGAYELEKNRHQGHCGEIFVASVAAAGFDVLLPRLGDVMDMQIYSRGPKGHIRQSPPAVSQNTIYITGKDGQLVTFTPSGTKPNDG